MPIEIPAGDLAHAKTHEPNTEYPDEVQLRLVWRIDGRVRIRSVRITAAEFFGRGSHGAPISGDGLVQRIEIMRKRGPPEVPDHDSRRPRGKR